MTEDRRDAPNVAIVGGGLCGLSLANFLRQRGIATDVYEQREAFTELGAGVQVDPSVWRLLEGAGLGPALAKISQRHRQGEMRYRMDGTSLNDPEAESTGLPYPCHRGDLMEVLAGGLDPATLHTGYRCIRYMPDGDRPRIEFANGESVQADVVVGCDGIHSQLRQYVAEPSPPIPSGSIAYRGVIDSSKVSDWYKEGLRIWMGERKHILIYPVRRGELLNFAGFVPGVDVPEESWSAPTLPLGLAEEFKDFAPVVRDFIAAVDATFLSGVYDREPLDDWTDGRLIVIGDAAHPFQPHYAQGVNQAIQDAAGLAQVLAVVGVGADLPDALHAFAKHRRSRTDKIAEESRQEGYRYDSTHGYEDVDLRDADWTSVRRRRFERWLGVYDVDREVGNLIRDLAPARGREDPSEPLA